MSDLTTRVAKTVGRHFVTLSCVQNKPNSLSKKTFVFSGFAIDVAGLWFYVTAGHILRDIRQALDEGDEFTIWRLGDQTAGNKFNGVPVPYHFDATEWIVLEDDSIGLDYAAVQLSEIYCLSLRAGGVDAIGKNAWSDHLAEYDHWVLVGIPSESVRYDETTLITARVVVAPLISTEIPSDAGDKAQNQFYAKLDEGSASVLKDVDGMSGGPIFALKCVDGAWSYGVIGVQSGWYRTTKTLAICPFSSFGLALEGVVSAL